MKIKTPKPCHEWTGRHKGVGWSVYESPPHEALGDGSLWAFYIYLHERMVPEADRDLWILPKLGVHKFGGGEIPKYNESESLWADLDWHVGLTYWKKIGGIDGRPVVIKAGCDYQHLYDHDRIYTVDWVLDDVARCIDSLHEAIPGMLLRCFRSGRWTPKDQGSFNEHGAFISDEAPNSLPTPPGGEG